MQQEKKVQGSIILKVVIVLLSGFLAFAIYTPNTIWTSEVAELEECHFRLKSLTESQTLYRIITQTYADSLEKIENLILNDINFKFNVDSMMLITSNRDTSEQVKTGKITRLYLAAPLTTDSLFTCPSSGLRFNLLMDSESSYKLICPTEEHQVPMYMLFKKNYLSHGEIDQSQNTTWE